MKTNSAIRMADHVLQSSDIFLTNNAHEDEKKKDPLSIHIWRMYSNAKDNLPNGSRLENLSWRMMALALKNNKDQEFSEHVDLKRANPEPELESPPMVQHTHASNFTMPLYTDNNQNDNPGSFYDDMPLNTVNFSSYQDQFNMTYDNNTMLHFNHDNIQTTQQSIPQKPRQRRTSSIKTAFSSVNEKRYNDKHSSTQCSNCSTKNTPLWRRDPAGNSLCNACGLFLKLHGVVRPLSLKTDVIKKRNRTNNKDNSSPTTTQIAPQTAAQILNKRRRCSIKRGEANDQLLGTSLPATSSFFTFSQSPPRGLIHSSSASSLVSLNQRHDYNGYSSFDDFPSELLPILTTDDNTLPEDSVFTHPNTYFY